ncbi:hypothetical protein T440DRAFT_482740 [Plenodomus tracheiphilus IPT5]|uniref:Uncharacterized protein n=1 Tax=Plenodomus tracheiphilus IPT5 TaxID=1408161 RepID=A0A6A7ASA4_9PLEO|nr:hypothetical protein T440DRAFT_482740 [Plenodomus tracheiphilus IPT5]
MQLVTILSALVATALATPLALPKSGADPNWKPNPGTAVTCDTKTDKVLGLYVGPQMETIINQACAAMMPDCAFPDKHPNIFCTLSIDYKLDSPKSSIQDANVQEGAGQKLPNWDAKLAVYPPEHPENPAGVFWTVKDCYGYFAQLLTNWVDQGGCHTNAGFGLGNITAGAGNSLEGTVFEVSVVPTP